jgi:squalene-hopene/tetraprenyl-beta-curcumene cyclase
VVAVGREALPEADRRAVAHWLLGCQHRSRHPYTHAAPGGWAWTDRSGGVPDADDTAGALLALAALDDGDAATPPAASAGVRWLLDVQNRDGGIPTFCRGWGALPFDRSSPDLTAHALRAWMAWRSRLPGSEGGRIDRAVPRAIRYLARAQRPDGAWVPLWFGNEAAAHEDNPTYGTARVLPALDAVAKRSSEAVALLEGGRDWLLRAQHADGGWGGAPGVMPTLEETGLALSALATVSGERVAEAVRRGVAWIVERTDGGRMTPASAIGLYFARLWYSEALYPLIFAVEGLRAARSTGAEA